MIGDHTDYAGGYALPIAVQLGTTVELAVAPGPVELRSADMAGAARVALDVADPSRQQPRWARYVAGVVAQVRPAFGGRGVVHTTLPVGAGLSSSAALEVALALALGFEGPALDLAVACQRAEQAASGVPCGIMDQMAAAAGVAGHALLLDCAAATLRPVRLPEGAEVVAVHSGVARRLAASGYAARRAAAARAAEEVGPLRTATIGDLAGISDGETRRRARHVVTENQRVLACAAALEAGRLEEAGALMAESHRSLRDDCEVSVPAVDELVSRLGALPSVYGARMTGGGFGGCVVALCEPGALGAEPARGWRLAAAGPAHLLA